MSVLGGQGQGPALKIRGLVGGFAPIASVLSEARAPTEAPLSRTSAFAKLHDLSLAERVYNPSDAICSGRKAWELQPENLQGEPKLCKPPRLDTARQRGRDRIASAECKHGGAFQWGRSALRIPPMPSRLTCGCSRSEDDPAILPSCRKRGLTAFPIGAWETFRSAKTLNPKP